MGLWVPRARVGGSVELFIQGALNSPSAAPRADAARCFHPCSRGLVGYGLAALPVEGPRQRRAVVCRPPSSRRATPRSSMKSWMLPSAASSPSLNASVQQTTSASLAPSRSTLCKRQTRLPRRARARRRYLRACFTTWATSRGLRLATLQAWTDVVPPSTSGSAQSCSVRLDCPST